MAEIHNQSLDESMSIAECTYVFETNLNASDAFEWNVAGNETLHFVFITVNYIFVLNENTYTGKGTELACIVSYTDVSKNGDLYDT